MPPSKKKPLRPTDAPAAYSIDLELALGVPEVGKSTGMKRLVSGDLRLVCWDPNDEYTRERCQRVTTLEALRRAMLAAGSGPARFAFVPLIVSRLVFEDFCRLARAWAEPGVHGRAPLTVLVEELADVVPPGRAPTWWGVLLRAGRHRGIKVRAVGHSPREVDKTVIRMATAVRVHTLGSLAERLYLEEQLELERGSLGELQPFHFVRVVKCWPRRLERLTV